MQDRQPGRRGGVSQPVGELRCIIRKDDVVEVVAGDDKGTRGKVLRVLRDEEQGRGRRRQPGVPAPEAAKRNPQGGRLSKEMPVDASNVMLDRPGHERADPRRRPLPAGRQQGTVREEERHPAPAARQAEPEVRQEVERNAQKARSRYSRGPKGLVPCGEIPRPGRPDSGEGNWSWPRQQWKNNRRPGCTRSTTRKSSRRWPRSSAARTGSACRSSRRSS